MAHATVPKYRILTNNKHASPLLTFAMSPGFTMPVKMMFQPKVSISCKTMHCPVTEKPICVKFKHKKAEVSTKEFFIYMINKCELQYIKCHQGEVEATVVPMKNCIHGKSSSPGGPVKKRPKRHIGIDDLSLVNHVRRKRSVTVALNKQMNDDYTDPKHKKSRKAISKRHRKHKHRNNHGRRKHKRRARSHHRRNEIAMAQIQGKLDNKTTINKTAVNNKATTKLQGATALKGQKTEGIKSNQTKVMNVNNTFVSRRDDGDKTFFKKKFFEKGSNSSGSSDDSGSSSGSTEKDIPPHNNRDGRDQASDSASSDYDDSDLETSNAVAVRQDNRIESDAKQEKEEVDRDCPTECPARAVMVCAQCQHGVYRTFISVCHMRMFVCNNQDEKLHLVSRYPCVLSAPFLTANEGKDVQPEGHATEPYDHDGVLRFIYCREADEFGSKKIVDPRCSHFKSYSHKEREKMIGKAYFDTQDSI